MVPNLILAGAYRSDGLGVRVYVCMYMCPFNVEFINRNLHTDNFITLLAVPAPPRE